MLLLRGNRLSTRAASSRRRPAGVKDASVSLTHLHDLQKFNSAVTQEKEIPADRWHSSSPQPKGYYPSFNKLSFCLASRDAVAADRWRGGRAKEQRVGETLSAGSEIFHTKPNPILMSLRGHDRSKTPVWLRTKLFLQASNWPLIGTVSPSGDTSTSCLLSNAASWNRPVTRQP